MKLRRRAATGRQRLRSTEDDDTAASKFSYRNRRSEAERGTGRQAQREAIRAAGASASHFWLQRFGLFILLVAAVASAINILTLSSGANVQTLLTDQPSNLLGTPAVYTAAADQLLRGSIWNRNKLTIDTGQLSRKLLKQFPELSSVSVTVPLLAHRPIIYIQPAQPAVILVSSTGSFLIDTSGKALLSAANSADLHQSNLPVISDQSGLKLQLNQQALPAIDVSFIQTVIAQLAAKHFNTASLTLPAAASELDVQVAGQPYTVKFNLQSNDARQQAGTFLATIAQLQKQGVTPAKYIDVRVDGRAYYQ